MALTTRTFMTFIVLLAALTNPLSAHGQIKKPGISYKSLLKNGGHVVGLRPSSVFILKNGILYSCRINSRKSMIQWCKELRAEGEKDIRR